MNEFEFPPKALKIWNYPCYLRPVIFNYFGNLTNLIRRWKFRYLRRFTTLFLRSNVGIYNMLIVI